MLRSYSRIARVHHACIRCPAPIEPGDEYNAEVWVGEGWFHVHKQHRFCPEERYDEEEEREYHEVEDSIPEEDREAA